MRLKKRNDNKCKMMTLRITQGEFNKMKIKANLYTNGNVSEWMATAALKYRPEKKDVDS